VSLARPSCELIKGANLYVSGLPKSMTQRELEALFVPCGNIITSRILCDSQTGRAQCLQFCFLYFLECFLSSAVIGSVGIAGVGVHNQFMTTS